MAGLFTIPCELKKISVLDAGAGSGILTCAIVERLICIEDIEEIELICYETDKNVIPLLRENLLLIKNNFITQTSHLNKYLCSLKNQ